MDIFDVLYLLGGLCLFLFGMNIMGQALERSAGNRLEAMLGKMTSVKIAGLFSGIGVTAVIQSSSATTVMVVGFVNSGIMSLKQAIHVMMGANVGTTLTAWILSLSGISEDNIFLKLLKPTSFTPILAVIGIILYMFCKSSRKKDIGTILLGFSVLMFGMDTMTKSVSGLADIPAFQQMFILFKNPILGVLVGALLTAIIQSSSASVGILQALAVTGQVSYGAAIPIIMGQNIGTCFTAMLSSIGATKNAKRAAFVHLSFNVIGASVFLLAYILAKAFFSPSIFDISASTPGIAVVHSIFNIGSTILLLPLSGLLEKLAYKIIAEPKSKEKAPELDNRLLYVTPTIALERCRSLTVNMAKASNESLKNSISCLNDYSESKARLTRILEEKTDRYEDVIGSFLVKISSHSLNDKEGAVSSLLLKIIGDLERISDHAINILQSAEEIRAKGISLSKDAQKELCLMCDAVIEITDMSCFIFTEQDFEKAVLVEPLEQVVDDLQELLKNHHITRLQEGLCSIDLGFIWNDLITNLERIADHCSNIAGYIIDINNNDLNIHQTLKLARENNEFFKQKYVQYYEKYLKPIQQKK